MESQAAPLSSVELVRLLAEADRLRVVAALVLAPDGATAGELAETTGIGVREVVKALDRLANGGLVTEHAGGRHMLRNDAFAAAARAEADTPTPSQHVDLPADDARVLDTAFVDGRLVALPSKHSKRLVVLDHLAQQFEIGTRYPEREVNEILGRFHPDYAMLRRYLVDEHFLDRAGGEYWRCGGSV